MDRHRFTTPPRQQHHSPKLGELNNSPHSIHTVLKRRTRPGMRNQDVTS